MRKRLVTFSWRIFCEQLERIQQVSKRGKKGVYTCKLNEPIVRNAFEDTRGSLNTAWAVNFIMKRLNFMRCANCSVVMKYPQCLCTFLFGFIWTKPSDSPVMKRSGLSIKSVTNCWLFLRISDAHAGVCNTVIMTLTFSIIKSVIKVPRETNTVDHPGTELLISPLPPIYYPPPPQLRSYWIKHNPRKRGRSALTLRAQERVQIVIYSLFCVFLFCS